MIWRFATRSPYSDPLLTVSLSRRSHTKPRSGNIPSSSHSLLHPPPWFPLSSLSLSPAFPPLRPTRSPSISPSKTPRNPPGSPPRPKPRKRSPARRLTRRRRRRRGWARSVWRRRWMRTRKTMRMGRTGRGAIRLMPRARMKIDDEGRG